MSRAGTSGLRAEVERFGVLSAARVADRYRHMVERALESSKTDGSWPEDGADGILSQLARSYLSMIEATGRVLGRETSANGQRVVLPPVPPGGTSQTSLWVHNPSASSNDLRLEMTALTGVGGTRIDPSALSLSPPALSRHTPEESVEVCLRLRVPPHQPPGFYHGFVLLDFVPEHPLAVGVRVEEPEVAG